MPKQQSATAETGTLAARVVAKVTHADGTEETFISENVAVADIDALEAALRALPVEPEADPVELAHEANAAESARNEAENARIVAEAQAERVAADEAAKAEG